MLYNVGQFKDDTDILDISNVRFAVEEAYSKIDGVQWFVTAINCERDRRGERQADVRFQICALAAYNETTVTKCDFVYNVLHDANLVVRHASIDASTWT